MVVVVIVAVVVLVSDALVLYAWGSTDTIQYPKIKNLGTLGARWRLWRSQKQLQPASAWRGSFRDPPGLLLVGVGVGVGVGKGVKQKQEQE